MTISINEDNCNNCMNMGCKRLIKFSHESNSRLWTVENKSYAGVILNEEKCLSDKISYEFWCLKYQPDEIR